MGQMASSSMFFQNHNNDFNKNFGLAPKKTVIDTNGWPKVDKNQDKA
jgi:hypothetical protein